MAVTAAYLGFIHSERKLGSFVSLFAVAFVAEGWLSLVLLRAEEARLTRELRTARTGTAVLRAMMTGRRRQLPLLGRLFSTGVGTAALLLADGDRPGALDALGSSSPLMYGGRLEKLRAVVRADLGRATGTTAGLEDCVTQLRAATCTGHCEADRYRMHVLVKAVLELGDADAAVEIAHELAASQDPELRLYATWLRVWFDLDQGGVDCGEWPPLAEGLARQAALVARAHGADQLVDKLEARLMTIARPEPQE